MLKFSQAAVALSFALGVAAGCGTSSVPDASVAPPCNPPCGTNQVCDSATNTCSCYTGYHPCTTDVDAGIVEDAGSTQAFVCANFALDNDNCGQCGMVCPEGQGCLGGTCQCHLTECTDDAGVIACTDPESDPNNCGGCNIHCPPDEACTLGICQCQPTVTIAQCETDAGLQCIDLTKDDGNCGGCGVTCAGNQECANPTGGAGICVCKDGGPLTDIQNCGGSCTDTTQDPFNCGACGVVCVSGSCSIGDAGIGVCNCPPPYTQCGPDCVDTFSDINHCGNCQLDCTIEGEDLPELACNLGTCYCGPTSQGTICPGPVPVCAKISTDKLNCGGCGSSDHPEFICTPPATECINETCVCPDGLSLCGNPDAGQPLFCTDTTQRIENCGTCGNDCTNTYAALSGCRFGICTCSPGQSTLCTDLPANPINPTCTCVTDTKGGTSPCSAPSFATDVYPLLAQQSGEFGCAASGCHSGSAPAAGLAFLDSSGKMDSGMAYAELLGTSGTASFGDGGVPFCDAGLPSNAPSKLCACNSLVTPGSVDQSNLIGVLIKDLPTVGEIDAGGRKLEIVCNEALMPEDQDGGWLPLTACSRQLIEQWITSGATP